MHTLDFLSSSLDVGLDTLDTVYVFLHTSCVCSTFARIQVKSVSTHALRAEPSGESELDRGTSVTSSESAVVTVSHLEDGALDVDNLLVEYGETSRVFLMTLARLIVEELTNLSLPVQPLTKLGFQSDASDFLPPRHRLAEHWLKSLFLSGVLVDVSECSRASQVEVVRATSRRVVQRSDGSVHPLDAYDVFVSASLGSAL